MQRLRCLKCNKFFDSTDKKKNKICLKCRLENNKMRYVENTISCFSNRRHRHSA